MKIAVAAMGNSVAGHFGHCENFIFFDTEDGKLQTIREWTTLLFLKILSPILVIVQAFCRISWQTMGLR